MTEREGPDEHEILPADGKPSQAEGDDDDSSTGDVETLDQG